MKNNLQILALFAMLLWSCEDVIQLDLADTPPQLAVEGWLTDQPGEKRVLLTLTSNYFDDKPNPGLSGALVLLYDNAGVVDTLGESDAGPGIYLTNYVGEIGKTYHISILTAEGKAYQSQPQLMREVPPITDISYEFKEEGPFQEAGYYVKISTFEPAGKGDHYRWRQFINGVHQNTPFDIIIASDELVDGNDIIDFEVGSQPLQSGDTCRIEQQSISREAFDFLRLLQDQTAFVGSIFDSPPTPIPGNIYNLRDPADRPLGFFGVSAVSTAEIVVE